MVEAPLPNSRPTPPPDTRVGLVSLFTSDPAKEYLQPATRPIGTLVIASVLFRRDAKVLRRLRKDRALFVDRLGELRWPARVWNLGSREKTVLDKRIGVHHRPNVRGDALALIS